ncbi:MAG: ATP-dependent helicase HrpB [Acidimicrobiia bacterium]|nr:ATP-dependent helicase HrpB [Acidimicrobiia bacterium]
MSTGSSGFPTDLPVVEALPELRSALASSGRAVLVAPPGAGKTTVVPLALLDEPWLGDRRIVMLEPRRLATRAAARRMAATTNTEVGALVGYQTRDERRIGPRARIEVVTEGVLTRRLQNDPELPGVACVIFDEVHERNLTTDLGLAFSLDSASTIRPDLRLLAMSATPDIEGLTRVLEAPVVRSEGRTFDVDIHWLPRAPAKGRVRQERIEPAVVSAVLTALGDGDGDVLVFLPGIGEIRRVEEQLRSSLGPNIDVYPLAGALSIEEQDAALLASPPGRRRVVLATDIAETSLTVAGVRIVVDSGLAREPRFDARTGMSRLTTVSTSRASAEQRAGRAGRTEPGTAYRLWSKIEHGSRARHRMPEIAQADLAGFALELAAWGAGDELAFIDRAPKGAMQQARELLTDLHALDADHARHGGAITPLGRRMLGLPVHPRLARMVAVSGSSLACAVATLVEERDIFRGRPDDLPVDLALRVGALAGSAGHDLADRGAVRRLRDRARDLARRAGVDWDPDSIDPGSTGGVLLLGFPDRLAALRRPGQFRLRSGSGAWISTDDTMAEEAFMVAADLDGRRDRARIRLGAAVDEADVFATFGDEIAEQRKIAWDSDRGDLVETNDRRLGALSLGRHVGRPQPGEATTAALMARVRATKLDALTWSRNALSLRHRVGFLHRTIGEPWPDWSSRALLATLDQWLAPYLPGATGRADLEGLDLTTVLRSQLPWPEGSELDALAPSALALPTGREAPIDYGSDQPQVSVRVQDLFGLDEHPAAGGHPIRLHLLSPADRPIQVTADLPGFWRGSWKEVRKEMAGRYPKHQWPKDPAHAEPKRLKGPKRPESDG